MKHWLAVIHEKEEEFAKIVVFKATDHQASDIIRRIKILFDDGYLRDFDIEPIDNPQDYDVVNKAVGRIEKKHGRHITQL